MAIENECPTCKTLLDFGGFCQRCSYQAPDPRVGIVLQDRYRIDALIGAGGMGRVYQATHLALGEPVAVKFLLGLYARDGVFRERFRREAQALAKLRHPAIVSILDFGEANDELYMVMELVRGVPLADLIHPNGPAIAIARIGDIFSQILRVLESAHREGIVHRDLKPENVMLISSEGRADHVKVLDFGLARIGSGGPLEKRLTETGTVHGTPHYMSPEQCRGIEVGARTDIYAVGCMLFEAIAGVPPFDAEEIAGLMAQQMFVDPPAIASVGQKREVPLGLERVVRRALAKSPDDRMSALEFRDMLASAILGTDPDTLMERAVNERVAQAQLDRSDRALTGVAAASAPQRTQTQDTPQRLVVWGNDEAATATVRDALSIGGFLVAVHHEARLPPTETFGSPVVAVILCAQNEGRSRLEALRAAGDKRPVVCAFAADAGHMAVLIRAGANDVTLADAPSEELVRKVKKLLKRSRPA